MTLKPLPYDLYPESMPLERVVLHVNSGHCYCGPATTNDPIHARPVRRHRDVERVEAAFEPFGAA